MLSIEGEGCSLKFCSRHIKSMVSLNTQVKMPSGQLDMQVRSKGHIWAKNIRLRTITIKMIFICPGTDEII